MSIKVTGVRTLKDGGTKELQLSDDGKPLTVFVDNRVRVNQELRGGVYRKYPGTDGNTLIRNRYFIQELVEGLNDDTVAQYNIASSILGHYGIEWVKRGAELCENVESECASNDEGVYPAKIEDIVLDYILNRDYIFEVLVNRFNRLIDVGIYISEVASPLILEDVMVSGTLNMFSSGDGRELPYSIWDNDGRNYCNLDTKSIITLHYDRRGDGETQTVEFPIEFLNETKFMDLVMRKAENQPMGKFILFQCQVGFDGGVKDMLKSSFNDLDKAIGYAKRLKCVDKYIQVVRHSTMEIVEVI